jgi:hypothetical protein
MSAKPSLMMTAIVTGLAGVLVGALLFGPDFVGSREKGQTDQRLPTYFPNTETLRPDEMRVTALGTGLPTPLTRAQKASAFMVELGNGDIFLFDLGTGSMTNLFGLRPDFRKSIRSS